MTFSIDYGKESLIVRTGKYIFQSGPVDPALTITLDDKYAERMGQIFGDGLTMANFTNVTITFPEADQIIHLNNCVVVSSIIKHDLDAVEYDIIFQTCSYEPIVISQWFFVSRNTNKLAICKALLKGKKLIRA